jgi:hypothetical protein
VISKAPTVTATAGTFAVTGRNFNGGADGSTFFTAKVDTTATGKNFVAAQVTKNGDKVLLSLLTHV